MPPFCVRYTRHIGRIGVIYHDVVSRFPVAVKSADTTTHNGHQSFQQITAVQRCVFSLVKPGDDIVSVDKQVLLSQIAGRWGATGRETATEG